MHIATTLHEQCQLIEVIDIPECSREKLIQARHQSVVCPYVRKTRFWLANNAKPIEHKTVITIKCLPIGTAFALRNARVIHQSATLADTKVVVWLDVRYIDADKGVDHITQ